MFFGLWTNLFLEMAKNDYFDRKSKMAKKLKKKRVHRLTCFLTKPYLCAFLDMKSSKVMTKI